MIDFKTIVITQGLGYPPISILPSVLWVLLSNFVDSLDNFGIVKLTTMMFFGVIVRTSWNLNNFKNQFNGNLERLP